MDLNQFSALELPRNALLNGVVSCWFEAEDLFYIIIHGEKSVIEAQANPPQRKFSKLNYNNWLLHFDFLGRSKVSPKLY